VRETVAVTINEVLLRGCTLKNSGFVVGLVVYTGPESRIQMNAAEPPRKQGALRPGSLVLPSWQSACKTRGWVATATLQSCQGTVTSHHVWEAV